MSNGQGMAVDGVMRVNLLEGYPLVTLWLLPCCYPVVITLWLPCGNYPVVTLW